MRFLLALAAVVVVALAFTGRAPAACCGRHSVRAVAARHFAKPFAQRGPLRKVFFNGHR